ncbi:MAG: hypothetical protein ACM3ST_00610 [Bdellovibrio bacteriovorus]
MLRTARDSETQTAEADRHPSVDLGCTDLQDPSEGRWVRSQLPLLYKILDQLDRDNLTPRQRIRALQNLKRPVLEMVGALSRTEATESDPKVSPLSPSPTPAQRLIERMCRNLDHLLLTLDRRRFHGGRTDDEARRWTIRHLFAYLGHQIEYGLLRSHPWPDRTWQRLHDLFEYLIERRDLGLDAGSWGNRFDPETAYKRLLLLSLCLRLAGARRLDRDTIQSLTRWASQTRLVEPAGRLGEYGLLIVETSLDRPPRYRAQPADDPWRGWVLEPPPEFLAFAGIRRSSLRLADPGDEERSRLGSRL